MPYNSGLPHGYDQWRTSSPPEWDRDPPPCTCRDSLEDHVEIEDPFGHLLLIRKLSDALGKIHVQYAQQQSNGKELLDLLHEADQALASCQAKGCLCRGYVEAEEDNREPEFADA
ncbi:hypothetical protein ANRL1_04562 [Anaerolineae bacterium]|nr:hypothetical protein ANRL1_04562 [Anaerolineae bacterium]